MIWRKGWIHPILQNRPVKNIWRGKELNKLCPPNRSDDLDLCLCFCLYPSSMPVRDKLSHRDGMAHRVVVAHRDGWLIEMGWLIWRCGGSATMGRWNVLLKKKDSSLERRLGQTTPVESPPNSIFGGCHLSGRLPWVAFSGPPLAFCRSLPVPYWQQSKQASDDLRFLCLCGLVLWGSRGEPVWGCPYEG